MHVQYFPHIIYTQSDYQIDICVCVSCLEKDETVHSLSHDMYPMLISYKVAKNHEARDHYWIILLLEVAANHTAREIIFE